MILTPVMSGSSGASESFGSDCSGALYDAGNDAWVHGAGVGAVARVNWALVGAGYFVHLSLCLHAEAFIRRAGAEVGQEIERQCVDHAMGVGVQALWNVGEALSGVSKVFIENIVGASILD